MKAEIDDLKEIVRLYPEYEDMATEAIKLGVIEIENKIKQSNNIKRNNYDNRSKERIKKD